MTFSDFLILIKKILVGILVYLIPAVIVIAGLLLVANYLQAATPEIETVVPINEFLQ